MHVVVTPTYEVLSDLAARIVGDALRRKPDIVLGLATGSTPEGLYARLVAECRARRLDFARATTFNLDEYVGLAPDHPQSYRRFMQEKLFDHVNIPADGTHLPDGLAADLTAECRRYEQAIRDAGGVALQVLGIGRNGHVGFNEPGTPPASRTHVTMLSEETVRDNARFFSSPAEVPHRAITMGLGTIMEAKSCLLLASGENKAQAVRMAVEGHATPDCPASVLQAHPDVTVIADEAAASLLKRRASYEHFPRG